MRSTRPAASRLHPTWEARNETRLGADDGATPLLPLSEVHQLWGRAPLRVHGWLGRKLDVWLESESRALQGEEGEGRN